MKLARMIAAAGLIVATLGVSGAADARDHRDNRHGYGHDRRNDDHRYHGGDRHRQHCRIERRHHRQVRVCR